MPDTSNPPFGLIVAYLLPGFIGLGGISLLVPTVATWLQPTPGQSGWEVGPPVYAILMAIAMGMIFSCIRWLVIDHIHRWSGIRHPKWDLAQLEQNLKAFNYIVEGTYRYYQFYANTLIAIAWTYLMNRWLQTSSLLGLGTDIGVVILCAILFAGSRDALAKYYKHSSQLVG